MAHPDPVRIHTSPRLARVRGAVRLAVEGIHGVSRIAEGLHASIARGAPPLGRPGERPAPGIAGFVYRTVRGGTSLVGQAIDTALVGLEALWPGDADASRAPRGLPYLAALNGVLGDHLARESNPLALPMELIVRGPAQPRLLLLVHGLCMSDAQWARKGHDHGQRLARALGSTPVYVRYNTGRHVSESAAELAQALEHLVQHWPVPLEAVAIVGHSMGGLVARSAVHQAQEAAMGWVQQLRQMVFLGTPHHGAPLERAGNWLHTLLGTSPYLAPFARLGTLRSDGITDLRHGNLLASDWRCGCYEHRDTRTAVSLPAGVACYAVAGTVAGGAGALGPLGDGLVGVDSALGRHGRRGYDLRLPASRTWLAQGVHHLDLLSDPAVYRKLRTWLC